MDYATGYRDMAGSGNGGAATAKPSASHVTWVHQQEKRLREELPGWRCWPIGTWDRKTKWNASVTDSVTAMLHDAESPDELVRLARAYEARLPQHLAEQRLKLADVTGNQGWAQDQRNVIRARIAAMENLAELRGIDLADDAEA